MTDYKRIRRTSGFSYHNFGNNKISMWWTFCNLIFLVVVFAPAINAFPKITDSGNDSSSSSIVPSSTVSSTELTVKLLVNSETLELSGKSLVLFDKDVQFYRVKSEFSCDKGAELAVLRTETSIQLSPVFGDNDTSSRGVGNGQMYLCYRNGDQVMRHLTVESGQRLISKQHVDIISRTRRQATNDLIPDTSILNSTAQNAIKIEGLRIERSEREVTLQDNGVPEVLCETEMTVRIFGSGLTEDTTILFTLKPAHFGDNCQFGQSIFKVEPGSVTNRSALIKVTLPKGAFTYYLCAKTQTGASESDYSPFLHQGTDSWNQISSYENMLPIWVTLIIVISCLCLSSLFSGLNLGLMSLDRTELKILCNTGTEKERNYAKQIQPVRDHGNYLLCSILLGNVLVNSTFTILLDSISSGLVAVVFSTVFIVIFGEITPQAICSRHGLAVGAKTIVVTKIVMILTFPLSYPVSKLLDCLLGEEIGNVYNRERLKELVRMTQDVNDLDKDEVNIVTGALEMRRKIVGDVMTHIEDVFMLNINAVLDFETVSDIMKSGFSRIPVYEHDRNNIVTLLFIKDLAFVDPDDNTPLKTLCEFYQNPCHFVFEDLTLDVMFRSFKEGHKGHMAFVHRVNNEGQGDPYYEIVGLVTLEDVIEEMIQAEIMDETDVFTDNRTKIRRLRSKKLDFSAFAERKDHQRLRISPQLTLATFQYLSTTIDAFKHDMVSETILRRLLNQDIVHHIKGKGKEKNDPNCVIYQQSKAVDYFVLILEGRVEVTVGRENLVFESGPFTYFGIQALVQNVGIVDSPQQPQIQGSLQSLNMEAVLRHTFVPDYSVRAVSDVVYLTIKRNLYLAAKRATLMERSQKLVGTGNDALDDEVEKLLHSLDEDDRSVGADTANLAGYTPRASKPTSNSPSLNHVPVPAPIPENIIVNSNGPPSILGGTDVVPQIYANLAASTAARRNSIPNPTPDLNLDGSDLPLLPRSKS